MLVESADKEYDIPENEEIAKYEWVWVLPKKSVFQNLYFTDN